MQNSDVFLIFCVDQVEKKCYIVKILYKNTSNLFIYSFILLQSLGCKIKAVSPPFPYIPPPSQMISQQLMSKSALLLAAVLHPDLCTTSFAKRSKRWVLFLEICFDRSERLSCTVQATGRVSE